MLTLAIDTSSPTSGIAIVDRQAILGTVSTTADETYSSRFFRQLEFLTGELQLNLADFALFVVVNGPGSFTGLRVGITTAKALAEAHHRPVIGISALDALASEAMAKDRFVVPVLDARRGQVFGAMYGATEGESGGELREVMPQAVLDPEEFLAKVKEHAKGVPINFITPVPQAIAPKLADFPGATLLSSSSMLAPAAAKLGERRAMQGLATSALELDANYIRRSDAELLWKAP